MWGKDWFDRNAEIFNYSVDGHRKTIRGEIGREARDYTSRPSEGDADRMTVLTRLAYRHWIQIRDTMSKQYIRRYIVSIRNAQVGQTNGNEPMRFEYQSEIHKFFIRSVMRMCSDCCGHAAEPAELRSQKGNHESIANAIDPLFSLSVRGGGWAARRCLSAFIIHNASPASCCYSSGNVAESRCRNH